MSSGRFRVDKDEDGNTEVSPAKPRKLRPLENSDEATQPGATGQPSATPVKSALKKRSSVMTDESAPEGGSGEVAHHRSSASSAGAPVKSALKSKSKKEREDKLGLALTAPLTPSNDGSVSPLPSPLPSPGGTLPTKSALKSAMKHGSAGSITTGGGKQLLAPGGGSGGDLAPPSPKPKSALKSKSIAVPQSDPNANPVDLISQAAAASRQTKHQKHKSTDDSTPAGCGAAAAVALAHGSGRAGTADGPSPKAAKKEAEDTVKSELPTYSVQVPTSQVRNRPSFFKMNVNIADPDAWTGPSLCKHYFHFASQKMLWNMHLRNSTTARRSISVVGGAVMPGQSALQALAAQGGGRTGTERRKSLLSSPQVFLEEPQPGISGASTPAEVEISPLKELLIAKKPDLKKLRHLLTDFSAEDRTRWINASLDATPPPMPSPLYHTVAAGQWDAMELLIEFKVDVSQHYQGKSMLKGWIKPNTPLIDSVQSRKGRFVGTMLGDKLEAVASLLEKTLKDQESGATPEDAPLERITRSRRRTKSIALKCSRGVMLHTQGHPTSKYELDSEFNIGGFSSVRAATESETGKVYAIKAGNKQHELSAKDPEAELWNEIVIMRKLEHPNIIKLYETYEDDTHIFMVFELCQGGELFERLVGEGNFPEPTTMRVAYQMSAAIRHVHSLNICHRDVRPEAFIVQDDRPLDSTQVKLIDFNTATEIGSQPLTTKICTLHYVAPEVLTATGYNEKVDIWSLGVVIYVMAAGTHPFVADDELEVLKSIKSNKWSFEPSGIWASVSQGAKDTVAALMTHDPVQRPDIISVMNLPRMVQAEEEGALEVENLGSARAGKTAVELQKNLRSQFGELMENVAEYVLDLRHMFQMMDPDKTGMVTIQDCKEHLLKNIEVSSETRAIREQLESADFTGKINYNMFLATMADKRRNVRREAAKLIFNTFDIDKNGNISLYEISQAMTEENHLKIDTSTVSSKEVDAIWKEMISVFAGREMSDEELSFEDFFKQLPKANLDINV